MGGEARVGCLPKMRNQVNRTMDVRQWKNIPNPFPVVPHCTLQNVKTSCCCIHRVPSRRKCDMKALHIGEKVVSTKHVKDEPKLSNHVPWKFFKPAASGINRYCHDHDIPSQPSHIYLCLLAVQTPPEQSLTKPEPIPGLSDPSTAFPKR